MREFLIWFVQLALCLSLSTAQYVNTYYVTPDSASISCGEFPCNNLNFYAHESNFSVSNTTLIFLPGVHNLDINGLIFFQNLENIQLLGSDESKAVKYTIAQMVEAYGFDSYGEDDSISYFESSATILCSNPSGFLFTNITNLTISNLTVLNCGTYSAATSYNASVHLLDVHGLTMEGIVIRNSTGYGLVGKNVLGQSQISRSAFVGNNQILKTLLTKQYLNDIECDGNVYPNVSAYFNMGELDYSSVSGGNVYFQYTDQSSITLPMPNQLSLSACLFSLGIDGTFTNRTVRSSSGTGLSIYSVQKTYNISIIISQTTLYRNQAMRGANLLLYLNPVTTNFTIANMLSSFAVGLESGVLMREEGPILSTSLANTSVSNFVIDSSFRCNVYSNNKPIDIIAFVNIGYSIYFINCVFDNSDVNLLTAFTQTYVYFNICNLKQTDLTVNANYWSKLFISIDNSVFQNSSLMFSDFYATQLIIYITECDFETSNTYISGYLLKINTYLVDCIFNSSRVHMSNSVVYLNNSVTFLNCFNNGNGGALALYSSMAVFGASSNVKFMNNTAVNGGALFLDGNSLLHLISPTNISFIQNTALLAGGAIHVVSGSALLVDDDINCFLTLQGYTRDIYVYFERNRAGEAGSMLYGGDIGSCKPPTQFRQILKIGFHDNSSSLISSEPRYICPCDYGREDYSLPLDKVFASLSQAPCSSNIINVTVYPGEMIFLPLITFGQANGTAPGIVLIYSKIQTIEFISVIRSSATCNLYRVPFKPVDGILYLTTQASFGNGQSNLYNIQLSITVPPCPAGFILDKVSSTCVCEQLLIRNKYACNITDQTVQKKVNSWIGYTLQGYFGIAPQCFPDYCSADPNVSIFNLDGQCINNRQKVLCGQCKEGLSTMLGSLQCKSCSNYYLMLLVPFALLGVVLVGLIFLLNVTVSTGTLSGLIFYANILKINDEIFFPPNFDNAGTEFFLAFIAWLNLDLGVETCFYNGMDNYAKTWLQFVFPIYLYILVGVIIFAGRYSSRISNLCRFNAVPVLSTIILLSYSKLLRTIITIFSSVSIDTQNATAVPSVWAYDGNIEFLGPKHTALFVFGLLVATLIIIPYTCTLLFMPWLQRKSDWRILWWVHRLKPFFDSHAAPYKDRYRFWPGVLLVVRLPLYVLFITQFSITTRLLSIIIFTFLYLLFLVGFSVYKRWQYLLLEMFFHLNLVFLSTAHLFDASYFSSLWLYAVLLVGLSCSFVGFVAIVIHHIHKILRKESDRKNNTPLQEQELSNYALAASVEDTNIYLREPLLD